MSNGSIAGEGTRLFFSNTSGPARRATQPHIQWRSVARSFGVKWQKRKADNSPPSNVKDKNELSYTYTPPVPK
jgi:hypothetical protein